MQSKDSVQLYEITNGIFTELSDKNKKTNTIHMNKMLENKNNNKKSLHLVNNYLGKKWMKNECLILFFLFVTCFLVI